MQRETYNITEFNKLLVEEVTTTNVVTTYKGICDNEDYVSWAEALPVWSIVKIVEDSSVAGTVKTTSYRPEYNETGTMDIRKAFVRDDRASLSYV
jgi:hypothetical protein